jgi:hypothetical protein
MKCENCKDPVCTYRRTAGECVYGTQPIIKYDSSDFYWQSFRNQAAKDILCAILSGGIASGATGILEKRELIVEGSIELTDELIKQLKEKEEK